MCIISKNIHKYHHYFNFYNIYFLHYFQFVQSQESRMSGDSTKDWNDGISPSPESNQTSEVHQESMM